MGSVTKKGNRWYCIYYVNNKQKWTAGGKTKREAQKKLIETEHQLNEGTYKELKDISFIDFANEYLEALQNNCKPSTLQSYKWIITKAFMPYFENLKLKQISPRSIQDYVNQRMKQTKPKTVLNELVLLNTMFKKAMVWQYLKSSPSWGITKPTVIKEEMDILSPDELNAFLNQVDNEYYVFFLTAVLTGARKGELLGLQWGDVNWQSNQIFVRRAYWKGKFVEPKSVYARRKIDLSPQLTRKLKLHYMKSEHKEDSDLIFCNEKGKPYNMDTIITKHFLPALRRARLRRIRFHDLRHSNASLRLAQGQNIKYIQKQMGHASAKITLDVYSHLVKDSNYEESIKLDKALGFEVKQERKLDVY